MQRNEGRWDFSMEESEDGASLVLEVDVGRFLDTSLIKADVQPGYIRCGRGGRRSAQGNQAQARVGGRPGA